MPVSIRYTFIQRFAVSAKKAFTWCTDYDPKDPELMHEAGVTRNILPITDGSLILKEIFPTASGPVEKQKLVKLYPDKFMWTNTHLTGPNKLSQFLYMISPTGHDSSMLTFTAHHIEYVEKMEKTEAKLLASQLRTEDAAIWKLLAKAMAEEVGK